MSLLELMDKIEEIAKDVQDIKNGEYTEGGYCPCSDGECSCSEGQYDVAYEVARDVMSESSYDYAVDAVHDVLRDDEIYDRIEALESKSNDESDDGSPTSSLRGLKGVLTDDEDACNCDVCQKNRLRWQVGEILYEFFQEYFITDQGEPVEIQSEASVTRRTQISERLSDKYDE